MIEVKKMFIVGTGAMGSGISQTAIIQGFLVSMHDID